eukprot:364491-Chlamydomonas_euryale.AAC.6
MCKDAEQPAFFGSTGVQPAFAAHAHLPSWQDAAGEDEWLGVQYLSSQAAHWRNQLGGAPCTSDHDSGSSRAVLHHHVALDHVECPVADHTAPDSRYQAKTCTVAHRSMDGTCTCSPVPSSEVPALAPVMCYRDGIAHNEISCGC